MDANSIFRIIVGILVLLGGLGWSGLTVLGVMGSDGPVSNSEILPPFLVGIGIAVLGVVILALPLFFH